MTYLLNHLLKHLLSYQNKKSNLLNAKILIVTTLQTFATGGDDFHANVNYIVDKSNHIDCLTT